MKIFPQRELERHCLGEQSWSFVQKEGLLVGDVVGAFVGEMVDDVVGEEVAKIKKL